MLNATEFCLLQELAVHWMLSASKLFNISSLVYCALIIAILCMWYGEMRGSVGKTTLLRTMASYPPAKCISYWCHIHKSDALVTVSRGHVAVETVLQQRPPAVNCRCWLMQVDMYGVHEMAAVAVFRVLSRFYFSCETVNSSVHWAYVAVICRIFKNVSCV